MERIRIYHNPKCSKSRGALEILRNRGIEPEIVEYLKTPPTRDQIRDLLERLETAPAELVRKDARFCELGLAASDFGTANEVVGILAKHPELMERPVVVRGARAIVARPSEKVAEILD